MKKRDKIIKDTIAVLLTLISASHAGFATAEQAATPETEKCYGIVKAGMNDCSTATASCAGSATKDKQHDAFIFLPKGTCEKIVGGVLKPAGKTDEKKGSQGKSS